VQGPVVSGMEHLKPPGKSRLPEQLGCAEGQERSVSMVGGRRLLEGVPALGCQFCPQNMDSRRG
jgi:hypothetical protein